MAKTVKIRLRHVTKTNPNKQTFVTVKIADLLTQARNNKDRQPKRGVC